MIKCPQCQKNIKYIISTDNEILIVDEGLHNIVTAKGRIVKGYTLHKCEVSINEAKR